VKQGVLTLSIINTHATLPIEADINLGSTSVTGLTQTVLAADDITAHNTFDEPGRVQPQTSALPSNGSWRHQFPSASVTVFRAQIR
jgi:alpha-N-arabinofuranosidase